MIYILTFGIKLLKELRSKGENRLGHLIDLCKNEIKRGSKRWS